MQQCRCTASANAGETMSPELLGWHERQGLDHVQSMSAATSSGSQDVKPEQPLSSFQFMRAPASALKSKRAADSSALGKAVRVKTPAKYAVMAQTESCVQLSNALLQHDCPCLSACRELEAGHCCQKPVECQRPCLHQNMLMNTLPQMLAAHIC